MMLKCGYTANVTFKSCLLVFASSVEILFVLYFTKLQMTGNECFYVTCIYIFSFSLSCLSLQLRLSSVWMWNFMDIDSFGLKAMSSLLFDLNKENRFFKIQVKKGSIFPSEFRTSRVCVCECVCLCIFD